MGKKSTISPDGVLMPADNGGSLVTSDDVWTFGTGKSLTGTHILLNGQWGGYGSGVTLKFAIGEKFYSHDATNELHGSRYTMCREG